MARKLKIGIIGSGSIARTCHMRGYQSLPEDCKMVAVCDVNPDAAKAAAEQYGIDKIYRDFHDLIADSGIDAVSVTTPNAMHVRPTVEALQAGKHVICEKPLGMNAAECREMCRAAKDSDRILQVALQSRFSGPALFVKAFIDAGKMGEIYYARAQALRRRGVPAWGVFIDKEKQGGGPLIDIGVHILDLTLFFMGYPKPVSAFGKTWDALGKNPQLFNRWGEYDHAKFTVEDFAVGLIKFENGAAVTLESSFMGNMDGDPYQTQLYGTVAGALVKPYASDGVTIYSEENRQLYNMTPANLPVVESAHVAEIQAFVHAILNRAPSPVPGENGLILNAIFDAIYRSSETGHEEAVDVGF